MDITGYVDRLREGLLAAAASGGDAMVDAAERLSTSLEATVRMTLLEVLADAAAELTTELEATTIEVRLKGRDPHFVVSRHAPAEPFEAPTAGPTAAPASDAPDDDAIARITLRLPDGLKQRAEDAAATARQSLNTWIVEAVRSATTTPGRRSRTVGQQLTGWVR